MRTVVGLFENVSEAQQTLQELVRLGFPTESISIATSFRSQRELEAGTRMSLSTIDVGDVGRIAAGGPLREALRGQNGPDATLTTMLRRTGLSNELADRYVAGVRQGETLESVVVNDSDADKVAAIMRRHSHIDQAPGQPIPGQARSAPPPIAPPIPTRSAAPVVPESPVVPMPTGRTNEEEIAARTREMHRFGNDEARTIPIVREELQVGKREIQTGVVRVNVHVVERPVSGDISLREEIVEVERHGVDRPLRDGENLFRDDMIEMREYGEEPIVSKRARVVEEVVLRKTIREHVERIHANVRDTEVQLERPFDPSIYKRHFDQLGLTGADFEEYAPAYRLGQELRGANQLRGSRWEDIEARVREQWETKRPGTWAKFKDAIQHAWSRGK